jgi:hypothetical protein
MIKQHPEIKEETVIKHHKLSPLNYTIKFDPNNYKLNQLHPPVFLFISSNSSTNTQKIDS